MPLEAMLEDAAERMDPGHIIHQGLDILHALPDDVKEHAVHYGWNVLKLRGVLFARFLAILAKVFLANPRAFGRNPVVAGRQLAIAASRAMGRVTHPPGMSPVQVRQYEKRQKGRGYVAGQNRQRGRQREMELEFELGLAAQSAESESAQTNWVYFRSWTLAPDGWKDLSGKWEGPWQMTKAQATQTISMMQSRDREAARAVGGTKVTVDCAAYFPVSARWVPCQNWV